MTDDGLERLKGLTSLQTLNLSDSKLTDSALVHLNGLTSLQELYLSRTSVTAAGVKDLQFHLPQCKIIK